MKYLLYLLASTVITLPAFSQWTEDFSSDQGSLSAEWSGETTKFILENGMLRLFDIAQTGQASLKRSSLPLAEFELSFYFRYGFNPSSSNFLKISLYDQESIPLTLWLGGDTSDRVRLTDQNGQEVLGSPAGLFDKAASEGTVTTVFQNDSIYISFSSTDGTTNFTSDTVYIGKHTLSIVELNYKFTSTRWDLIWLDKIKLSGKPVEDKEPPSVKSTSVSSDRLTIWFSEPVLSRFRESEILRPMGWKPFWSNLEGEKLELIFIDTFPMGVPLEMFIGSVTDMAGNSTNITVYFMYLNPDPPPFRGIVFSEIMFDPSPSNGLPESEYLELSNLSGEAVSLSGGEIRTAGHSFAIPDYVLMPDSSLLLLPLTEIDQWEAIENKVGMESWPALTNAGRSLSLWIRGSLIDSLYYLPDWHTINTDGGISLSRKRGTGYCQLSSNWSSATEVMGGSPGRTNETIDDSGIVNLVNAHIKAGEDTLRIEFDLPVDRQRSVEVEFQSDITGFGVVLVNEKEVKVTVLEELESNRDFTFEVSGLQFCQGTWPDTFTDEAIVFGMPEKGNLVLSEVLFNPRIGGVSFIEVTNMGVSPVDIDLLEVSLLDNIDIDEIPLWNQPKNDVLEVIRQGKSLAICRDADILKREYPGSDINNLKSVDFRSLPKSEGCLLLLYDGVRMDSVCYSEYDHFSLLEVTRGRSLSRILPLDKHRDQEWYTTSLREWATPGWLENHVYSGKNLTDELEITPSYYRPLNEISSGLLRVDFDLGGGRWLAYMQVFHWKGGELCSPDEMELAEGRGTFFWNPLVCGSSALVAGFHVVVINLVDDTGNKKVLRGAFYLDP